VNLSVHGDQLHLNMNGIESGGLSLSHMRDRIEATGGSVSTTSRDGRTFLEVRASSARTPAVAGRCGTLPAGSAIYAAAAAHTSRSRSGPNADLVR
jgi:hypothetical protein